MHDIHKISVDVPYLQVTDKKGIKRHGERSISEMYKYNTQIYYMKLMGVLYPASIIKALKG